MNEDFIQAKREALLRRSDKLLAWLDLPEYTNYSGDESVEQLMTLIDLVTWALERSIAPDDWRQFKSAFRTARNTLVDFTDNEKVQIDNFQKAVRDIRSALLSYREFVSSHELVKVIV